MASDVNAPDVKRRLRRSEIRPRRSTLHDESLTCIAGLHEGRLSLRSLPESGSGCNIWIVVQCDLNITFQSTWMKTSTMQGKRDMSGVLKASDQSAA